MKATIFKDFAHPCDEQDLLSIFETIKSSKFESDINSIRLAYHQEDKLLGDDLKKQLPAFTPSGTFSYRNAESLVEYNQIIHLDFDDLDYTELKIISDKINACSYTFASFISPKGKGLKVFIKTNSKCSEHKGTWSQLTDFYKELIGLDSDTKCKDICRLCFFSHDKNLFLNTESEVFQSKNVMGNQISLSPEQIETPKSLEFCNDFTNKKSEYMEGNRNNHVFLFAANANRFGIPENETLDYLLKSFDLNSFEIRASVKSAYKNNIADFAKFANIAKGADKVNNEKHALIETEDNLLSTPLIPMDVYENLPSILQMGIDAFEERREKDVYFVSAIAILSGCVQNVTGLYMQKVVYPNLYSFILAPAASGKQAMISAKELADVMHREILDRSLEEQKIYERDLREYKKRSSPLAKNKHPDEEPPKEPLFKVLYIPANTSSSMIYKHIADNGGHGIICETEADTLGAVFKNDWGSYSDLLRRVFHHERIALSRKTNKEYLEVDNPRLSIALSGTPNQIFNIIQEAEDGLFSRFIYYLFKADLKWISPAPNPNRVNLTEHFKFLGKKTKEMGDFLQKYPTNIILSDNQWQKFNDYFSSFLLESDSLYGSDASSVVKRLGLIVFRMCMLFTAIRKYDDGDTSSTITCSDLDFDNVLTTVDTLAQHSMLMYNNLPRQSNEHAIKNKNNKQKYLEALPQTFQRKEAVAIGLQMGIKERTVDSLLKKWLGKYLQKEDTGFYSKLQ